ncbi:50S ribosomal protein L23 [Elusimicrobiota bacterium]
MSFDPHLILRRPLLTEKSTNLKEGLGQYVFEVSKDSNKGDVRRAIESVFKVDVTKVRIINVPGKLRRMGRNMGYRSDWKKAIVKIKSGQKIDMEKVS